MRMRHGLPATRAAWLVLLCTTLACVLLGSAPTEASAQATRRISVEYTEAPMRDVLHAFAAFSGRSIVSGPDIDGVFVTASINDQPWDVALAALLDSHALRAIEDEYGILRVEGLGPAAARAEIEPLLVRSYRLSFTPAAELQPTIAALLTERGSVTVAASTNALVVSDVARVHDVIRRLVGG